MITKPSRDILNACVMFRLFLILPHYRVEAAKSNHTTHTTLCLGLWELEEFKDGGRTLPPNAETSRASHNGGDAVVPP